MELNIIEHFKQLSKSSNNIARTDSKVHTKYWHAKILQLSQSLVLIRTTDIHVHTRVSSDAT